jgi:titin
VTGASGKVTVSWNAPSHLGSGTLIEYEVTAYDAEGNVAGSCNPVSGQGTCEVSGLDNGSSYTFKVVAITSIGSSAESSASSVVIPAGVPSAPANVVAITSGSNMTVTFGAPSDNGGSAITSYVVTSSPAGATCTVGANSTTYTCTGLTAGTNYTYSVKAVNSKGESSASLVSEGVTAVAAPSAPLNVSAVITAGTTTLSATVSFDPPASENGSPVTSYTVTASPGGATCTVTAPRTYCDIPVLPDSLYTFTARATNAVGTSSASVTSLSTAAANGIAPTLVVDPIPAPTGDLEENKVLSSNIGVGSFNSTPNSVVTYQWKSCTDPLDAATCTSISGATSATYTLSSSEVDKYIRVEVRAINSIGTLVSLSDATAVVIAAPVSNPPTPEIPSTPGVDPTPVTPSCDVSCQAIRDAATLAAVAAEAVARTAAVVAIAEAAAKVTADANAKIKSDADATAASTKASADAASAAAAAKAAVDKAAAAAVAQIAADAAAKTASAAAKIAADAQSAATKAAADARAILKNATTTAATKAAATKSANNLAAAATAAVKAAATAAQKATVAKNAASNAKKKVDIAINSLTSRTAAGQSTAQANAIAAAAKAAANATAKAAADAAVRAKADATAALKAASDAADRIATDQKLAADTAALAKIAADSAAKATADKITADSAVTKTAQELASIFGEKAALTEQAAKVSDETTRTEIQKKIDEVTKKIEDAQKASDIATLNASTAASVQTAANLTAEVLAKEAQIQATVAAAIKTESVTKTTAAAKAVTTATVAEKVAAAAKEAAARVPSKAAISTKPSQSTNKNSAKATVTGLKPGQKVKVTVNVKPKP